MIMMQGTYYKEWSSVLNREMEFKVYGSAGVPVLALPARGGRFFDWENNGMPDAIAQLLNEGKIQLFCADSVDGEGVLNGDLPLRRRAEAQEKYFVYLTAELAPRILTLNKAEKGTKIWCAGVDLGAYQAVNCRLRRPNLFAGAVGMGGIYDLSRFWGAENDDLVLRCSPLLYLQENGIANKLALVKAEENSLILCAGQGAYEDDAKADTQALADVLKAQGLPAHLELWGGDVSHDWYWWGKMEPVCSAHSGKVTLSRFCVRESLRVFPLFSFISNSYLICRIWCGILLLEAKDTPKGFVKGACIMESTEKKPCCCCSTEEPAADTVFPADVPDAVPSCCRHKDRSPEEYKALVNRLSRIEGQVRGVRGMLEKDAYCVDILVQVAAVNSALNSFAKELLAQHMSTCVADDLRAGSDEKLNELIRLLPRLMK